MAKDNKIELLAYLLQHIVSHAEKYINAPDLLSALSSQQGLAKYANPEQGIHPTSLNTLKRQAAESTTCNFACIDELRKKAFTAVREKTKIKSTKHNRTQLAIVIANLEDDVALLEEELATLTWLSTRINAQARHYAQQADPSTQVLCDKEQAENFAMLAARQEETRKRRRSKTANSHEN